MALVREIISTAMRHVAIWLFINSSVCVCVCVCVRVRCREGDQPGQLLDSTNTLSLHRSRWHIFKDIYVRCFAINVSELH